MLAALVVSLVLAAPSKGVYAKDVKFALDALEQNCGHFFKSKGIHWGKVRKQFLKETKKTRTDAEHWVLLSRLVARIRDGHAGVYPTSKTKGLKWPDQEPKLGPGVCFCLVGQKVYIKSAWGDAAKAGVKPGMEVLRIGKVSAGKWLDARVAAMSDLTGFSTNHQARYAACHWGLGAPARKPFPLELRTVDKKKTKKITLSRTSRSLAPWGPAFPPKERKTIGRQSYGRTAAGYGYIHLRDSKRDLPNQLDTMLAALQDVPGLILDFRANGGGSCDHDAVFGRFVPPGKTLSFRKSYKSQGSHPYVGPVVVIVDAGVRSAGETVSGILKEDGRAYMIGPEPTAGMSGSKRTLELPSGLFSLYVVVASNKGRFNGGKGVEGIGVPPHEQVDYDPHDLANEIDTMIQRAEELLTRGFPKNKVPYKPKRYGWKKR